MKFDILCKLGYNCSIKNIRRDMNMIMIKKKDLNKEATCREIAEIASNWWARRLTLNDDMYSENKRTEVKEMIFISVLGELMSYPDEVFCLATTYEGPEPGSVLESVMCKAGLPSQSFPRLWTMEIQANKLTVEHYSHIGEKIQYETLYE